MRLGWHSEFIGAACLSLSVSTMRTLTKIITPLLMMLCTGCYTAPSISPKEAYFRKHPELRTHYHQFWETSPEEIADAEGVRLTSILVLVHIIQNQYTNYPDLLQHMALVEKRTLGLRDEPSPFVQEIKRAFDPKTDTLFWYCDENGEKGHVIVRHGDCYRKFVAEGPIKIGEP